MGKNNPGPVIWNVYVGGRHVACARCDEEGADDLWEWFHAMNPGHRVRVYLAAWVSGRL